MKFVGSHMCIIEKSHVTLTCKQFRSCAVNITTLPTNAHHIQQGILHEIQHTTIFANTRLYNILIW